MPISSFTSFVDGDPSSPEHFNSKFGPIVDATVNATGIQVLSNGSSLGTATSLNFVGSSSVSSQAAGQISVAVPTITGTGSRYARFNSAGTGIEDANLADSSGTVTNLQFAQPSVLRLSRYNGSSSATTAIGSNQSIGGVEFWSFHSDAERRIGWFRMYSGSVGGVSVSPRMEWGQQNTNNGSELSVMQLIAGTDLSPTPATHGALDLGGDGRLWNRFNGREVRIITEQPVSASLAETRLYGVYSFGAQPYSTLDSQGTELRLTVLGGEDSGVMRILRYSELISFLSPMTSASTVMRLGGRNGAPDSSRWHSINVQGVSTGVINRISSYSATTTDCVISVDSSSNLTVSLPAPSSVSGHWFSVKRAGAGTLEVNAGSGASLDQFSVFTLASQWSAVQFHSVGTRYIVTACL